MNKEPSTVDRILVLGAGSSGLAVAKRLKERKVPFECIEREDDVGGNWYYGKPHSSVYRSARLISSKRQTEYTDYPMPSQWPEHPSHELVWQYLRQYARHFELYPHIKFNTSVKCVEPASDVLAGGGVVETGRQGEFIKSASDGASPSPSLPISHSPSGWNVTFGDGTRRRYRGVVVANGHNWDPRWPQYAGEFSGQSIHAAQYKSPEICRGRRVLVVGGGNSGFDIAVDVAASASATFHSMRRQYHVLPRYLRGAPIDQCGRWARRWRIPLWLRRTGATRAMRKAWGEEAAHTLPKPDHRLFESHPVINSRWPYEVSRGTICLKPDVRQLSGDAVEFADESREPIDLIIYATGYKLSFPFLDRRHLNWRDDRPELYLNVFHPERDDIFVAGLIQPDSGQFGLVDLQAQLIAAYLHALDESQPAAIRFRNEKRRRIGTPLNGGIRYVRSPRHLVEVEHESYRRLLRRCIARFARVDGESSSSKCKFQSVDA